MKKKIIYTVSEQEALKKLGIKSFREMSKKNIAQFVSMMPEMDPEVVKGAIEQFPKFKELASEMVKELSKAADHAIAANAKNQDEINGMCKTILDALREELRDPLISAKDRARIEDNMIKVAQMAIVKDAENKRYHLNILGMLCSLFAALFAGLFVLLKVWKPGKKS